VTVAPPLPGQSALLAPAPTRVVGILNVTPDSFSDGGLYMHVETAVAQGLKLAAEGAALVDVGGESTRPGAERVDAATEIQRVLPVVTRLAEAGIAISVDTMRAEVAARCVEAGAVVVNDVSGGLADPEMLSTVAALGCMYVAMHWRAHSTEMNDHATYDDVVAEVVAELLGRVRVVVAAGIEPDRLASAFAMFVRFPDVDFSASPTHVPDVAAVRVLVEQLLDRANHMMPRDEPDSGWDALQLVVRRLLFERRNDGWNSTP